jgi:sulfite reductase (NADPH) flavoprotein alpha-component
MNNEPLILFGTTTGNAEECATRVAARIAVSGAKPRLANMNSYAAAALAAESSVLVVVSTWGDGEPPDDALGFYEGLRKLAPGSLKHLRFAVFGLGDTGYENFCGCGKMSEHLLAGLGATALLPRVDADVDYEDNLVAWTSKLVEVFKPGGADLASVA